MSHSKALSPQLIIACGCLIAMIAFGVRSTVGLFVIPMGAEHGWDREVFGIAFAVQNLLWGIAQPIAAAFVDRLGSMRVVLVGTVFYASGALLMAFSTSPMMLTLGGGVLMGIGIATTSFSIIMPAFGRLLPAEQRSWAFGIATAASSVGQFVFAPLGQVFIANFGWQTAMVMLTAFLALLVPLVLPFGKAEKTGRDTAPGDVEMPLPTVISAAFGHPSFILLVIGFFVCGFHVAFITVHMPPFIQDLGLSPSLGAWSIALIGIFNVIGSYSSGLFGAKYSKRYGLSFIYAARAIVITIFITAPITPASVLIFSAAMGLLWLSTIPLTIGLVTVMFGTRYMAMLYGFVFLSHQIGSFLGVWLGGRIRDLTGSYDMIWYAAIAFGVASAIVHWPIRETISPRFAAVTGR
jgi:predicted MFS family arabinose efflux permease